MVPYIFVLMWLLFGYIFTIIIGKIHLWDAIVVYHTASRFCNIECSNIIIHCGFIQIYAARKKRFMQLTKIVCSCAIALERYAENEFWYNTSLAGLFRSVTLVTFPGYGHVQRVYTCIGKRVFFLQSCEIYYALRGQRHQISLELQNYMDLNIYQSSYMVDYKPFRNHPSITPQE
ncbi:hypothetical protein STEG23_000419, partial [Scotinomys teguina]